MRQPKLKKDGKIDGRTKRIGKSCFHPVWSNADDLQVAIDAFFVKCQKLKSKPTIQKLALELGYCTSHAIWENRQKGQPYEDQFNRAVLMIESGWLDSVSAPICKNVTGQLFVLRSMGVTDKAEVQKIDITSNGEKLESSSLINCQVINPETSDILKMLEQNNGNPKESSDTSIET